MNVKTYEQAEDFLRDTRVYLEQNEAVNGLMLGLAFRLAQFADQIKIPPFLATIADDAGLAVVSLMTPPHKLLVYSDHQDATAALEVLARFLYQSEWTFPAVLGPAPIAERFAQIWSEMNGINYEVGMRQRVFVLHQVQHPPYPAGHLRPATAVDTPIITDWLQTFHREALAEEVDWTTAREMANGRIRQKDIYIWDNGQPVAMAAKVRPTRNGMTISLVYTPPEQRRHGYATACVAALSQQLLDEGWQFCTLFTDLANPTSNSIYQKIGYQQVADFNDYLFDTAE